MHLQGLSYLVWFQHGMHHGICLAVKLGTLFETSEKLFLGYLFTIVFHSKSGAQVHIKIVKEVKVKLNSVFEVVKYILKLSENDIVGSVFVVPLIISLNILKEPDSLCHGRHSPSKIWGCLPALQ